MIPYAYPNSAYIRGVSQRLLTVQRLPIIELQVRFRNFGNGFQTPPGGEQALPYQYDGVSPAAPMFSIANWNPNRGLIPDHPTTELIPASNYMLRKPRKRYGVADISPLITWFNSTGPIEGLGEVSDTYLPSFRGRLKPPTGANEGNYISFPVRVSFSRIARSATLSEERVPWTLAEDHDSATVITVPANGNWGGWTNFASLARASARNPYASPGSKYTMNGICRMMIHGGPTLNMTRSQALNNYAGLPSD